MCRDGGHLGGRWAYARGVFPPPHGSAQSAGPPLAVHALLPALRGPESATDHSGGPARHRHPRRARPRPAPRPHADGDGSLTTPVEVPPPGPRGSDRDRGGTPQRGASGADAAARAPPACIAEDGASCAEAVLATPDLISAVDVSFGAVAVDSSLTLRRLQLIGERSQVRWSSASPHVVDDVAPAAKPTAIVALDAADGCPRWQLEGPFDDLPPLASGVAVIHDGRLDVLHPDHPGTRRSRDIGTTARFAQGTHRPNHRPIPATGTDAEVFLDPHSGEVLAGLGRSARATRTTTGQVVAAVWEDGDDGADTTLLGFGIDGQQRWQTAGPEQACCRLELRPTDEGRVIATFPGAAGTETA